MGRSGMRSLCLIYPFKFLDKIGVRGCLDFVFGFFYTSPDGFINEKGGSNDQRGMDSKWSKDTCG